MIDDVFEQEYSSFTLIRKGKKSKYLVSGFFATHNHRDCIQITNMPYKLTPKFGDELIDRQTGEKYRINGVATIVPDEEWYAYYDIAPAMPSMTTNQYNFNGSISYSSIGGNQNHIMIQQGYDFNQLRQLIDQTEPIGSKNNTELQRMADTLEAAVNSRQELPHGLLSKFNDLLTQHDGIAAAVIQIVFSYLTNLKP